VRITSTQVAQEAGVSQATVSYVLNDSTTQRISPETRASVRAAAERLGYRPHAAARALRKGRSDTVLLPFAGFAMVHVLGEMVNASSVALARHGLTLVTDLTTYPTPEEKARAWLRLDPTAIVDLLLPRDDKAVEHLRHSGVSVVSAAVPAPAGQLSAADVLTDEARHLQVRHVLDQGARNLVLAAPSADRRAYIVRGRQRAMRQAVRRAGAKLTVQDVEMDRESMRAAARGWRNADAKPDAICAYNDELAIGLLSALAEQGVRVPHDLAVIGLDDLPLAAAVSPTVTTVRYAIDEAGDALAATAKALIDGADPALRFFVPPSTVVVRESA
jgi:DNA-binding LacI/PurR family transcriptional regulator